MGAPDSPDARVHPSLDDPVVAGVSAGIGGPIGTRSKGHRWWTPLRVILALTALTFALGMVSKSSCVATEWRDGEVRYSHMCYSDLPYLYTGRGFVELNWPYSSDVQVRERYEVMEYPVGISYWAWGTAHVTQRLAGSPNLEERFSQPADAVSGRPDVVRESMLYVVVNALGLALVTLLAAYFLVGVNPRRPWDAAGFALSPALALTGLINWDLLAVALVAGALWAWARDRPGLTGVMIGLGTATKLYPLFLLGGLLIICWRERRWRDFGVTVFARRGVVGRRQRARLSDGAGPMAGLLELQLRPGCRLGLRVDRGGPGGEHLVHGPHDQHLVLGVLRGVVCGGVVARAVRAADATLGPAGVPDRGGVLADQ